MGSCTYQFELNDVQKSKFSVQESFAFFLNIVEKSDVIILASWYFLLCHYNKGQQYLKIYV